MTLQPGTKRGSHEILAPLVARAMALCHPARGERLERDVAARVLPASSKA
jgi:hypothetical protein